MSRSQKAAFDAVIKLYVGFKMRSPYVHHCEMFTLDKVLTPQFVQGKDVLDAGCGFGFYSKKLAQMQPRSLVAIDVSRDAVELASWHNREHSFVQFRVQDNAAIGAVEQFDLILANYTLQFSKTTSHLKTKCESFFAALRPGGCLLGFIPNGDTRVDFSWSAIGQQVSGCYVVPADVHDGQTVEMHLYSGETDIGIPMQWYNHATYQRCLEAAGFSGSRGSVAFMRPMVTPCGIRELGIGFWTNAILPPIGWMMMANKF